MDSYVKYRLNDSSELAEYQKDMKKYLRFVSKVYSMLDSLLVGQTVNVDDICRPTSLDIFIKVVCCYILYRNPRNVYDSYVEFSTDYKKITRQPGFQKGLHYKNHFYDKEQQDNDMPFD